MSRGEEPGRPVVLVADDDGTGRLFFQTSMPETHSSLLRDGSFADNEILSTALALRDAHPEREIVLVSKDINLRIKAAILGVQAMHQAGMIDLAKSIYLGATVNWLATIVGGLIFGFGMVVASGCPAR